MNTKILVVNGDSFIDALEGVVNAFDDLLNCNDVKENKCHCGCNKQRKSNWCTTSSFDVRDRCPFGVAPTFENPCEDKNKRFGAGFEIDEPRAEDYAHRWMFESDHAAYDRFVDAGEDCVARGMKKKSDAPIHKVKAFRRNLEDGPVFGVDLVGETHWF